MTLAEAASSLALHLTGHSWFVSVKQDKDFFFPLLTVRATRQPTRGIVPETWEGFAVAIEVERAKP
ncbi:MAG: hypothetical protein KGL39_40260 [Patescibacteria group bacterium]|nr:hypothetical protein [Patescibacteria group bacterium]